MKSTKDIYLAAAWLSMGAKLERTDKTDKRHMEFFFSPKPLFETGVLSGETSTINISSAPAQDLDKIETDWVNEVVVGNLVSYKNALQRLKAVVHSD